MSDKEKTKEKELNKVIEANEATFKISKDVELSQSNAEKMGLCGKENCKYLQFVESEFSVLFAKCDVHNINLNQKTPVTKCSSYEKKGSMTLWDMRNIAYLIDNTPDKKKAGFGRE